MDEMLINNEDSSISRDSIEEPVSKEKKFFSGAVYYMIIFFIVDIICLLMLVIGFFLSITIIYWIFLILTIIFLIFFIISIIFFGIKINKSKEEDIIDQNQIIDLKEKNESDKLIEELEESKINFINIGGQSCYQSSYLQGFMHIVIPAAIKHENKKREKQNKEKVKTLDELKNKNDFNNAVLDTIQEVVNIQKNGGVDQEGNKGVSADNIYNFEKSNINAEDDRYDHEGLDCEELINKANDNLIQPNNKINNNFSGSKKKANEDLINIIELKTSTSISEVMKLKIDNKYVYNIILNFDENTRNKPDLDLFDLLDNCKQLKNNRSKKKKIKDASDIIYMIIHRISNGEPITKNFTIYEEIYLNNKTGIFEKNSASTSSTLYELKFIIVHRFSDRNSGHYYSYCKIKGKWYVFNDCQHDDARLENPPLTEFSENVFPISFYFVKSK